jgi:hypothetical protein
MNNTITQLKKFINESPRNRLKLAEYLGYSSSTTVSQWIKRKSIPSFQEDRVKKYIEEYFNERFK